LQARDSHGINKGQAEQTVKDVFSYIEQNSNFVILYSKGILSELEKKVSIDTNGKNIEDILKELASKTVLEYAINDRQITVMKRSPIPVSTTQQVADIKITGQVLDKNSEPLVGVPIIVKGTTTGVVTDVEGKFSISVKPGAMLLVRFIGFKDQEIQVTSPQDLRIVMQEDEQELSEVVVTAFGTGQKKESVVGAIQTVRPNDLKIPSANLSNSFAGRMAGVVAFQRSGQPGSNSSDFYIRGISTLSGITSPLIILDGVEVSKADLNALDPEVIDNFSILKDATATAMYGTRGANGVMIITTKGGADTERPIISFRLEGNVSQPTNIPKFADAVTYMKMFNEASTNQFGNAATGIFTQDQINGTINNLNPYIYPNVDWYNELFKEMTFNQKANFNIRGGNKKLDYFMNVAVNHETGMLKNTSQKYGMSYNNGIDYRRYAFQNNLNFHMSKSSTIALRLNVMLSDLDGPSTNLSDIYNAVMNTNPVDYPIQFPQKDEKWVRWGIMSGGNTQGSANPVAVATRGYKNTFESTVLANLDFEQKLDFVTKGLRFKAMLSFKNWTQSVTDRNQPYNKYALQSYVRNQDGTYALNLSPQGTPEKPVLGTSGSTGGDRRIYLQTFVDYNRNFGNHNVSAMVLYNQDQYNNNVVSDLYSALSRRKQGLAFRASYDYDGRYLLEFNAGYNGSENFAKGHRFGFFPSVAAGYNISREQFWTPLENIVSNLKIRGSYGLVGNDQITDSNGSLVRFIYLEDVNLQNSDHGFTTGYGVNATTKNGPSYNRFRNNNITWEIGHKLNVGIDMQLFRSLNIVFDAFHEIRSNIFQQKQSIPNYFGTAESVIYGNLAKVKSWGWDTSVDYGKQINKDLSIQFKGTFTYARNSVLKYDEAADMRPAISKIGKPVNAIWGYITNGLYIDYADIANNPASSLGNIAIAPGDVKYVDQPDTDGTYDGKIDNNDRQMLGYPTIPEIVYGFGPSIAYKKWDFSFFMQGVSRTSLMMSEFQPFGQQYNRNVLKFVADNYWTAGNQNPNAAYPRLTRYENNHNTQSSDYWLRDGSFLKLKNAEIGYSLKNMRFYVSGTNLLTFSGFKYWDPEMGGGKGLSYPTQRVFNIGFQMSFK
jgi:TonB-linked SusC/RagA family outer membrane protein